MSNYRFHSPHIVKPWSNVDGRYVNVGATNNPSNFGSNETSREFGLSGIVNNVKAAAASVLQMKGGSRAKKNKISRKYTMATKKRSLFKRGKMMIMKMAKSVKRRFSKRRGSRSGRRGHKGMRGGTGHYIQYGSNAAANASYSTGGVLSASRLGEANPVPHQAITGNCPNAYKH